MAESQRQKQNGPRKPSPPAKDRERHKPQRDSQRDPRVPAAIERVENVSAIQLARGDQIERSRKQSYPRRAADGMKYEIACGDAWLEQRKKQTEGQRRAEVHDGSDFGAGDYFGVRHAERERRNRENESDKRAGDANIEQRAARGNRRADSDERAERADQRRRGNEVRIARIDAVCTAREKVAEFMREQDAEQRECEWNAGGEEAGMSEQFYIERKKYIEVGISAL